MLSEAERDEVRAAVQRAEAKSSGQILSALVESSGEYSVATLTASLVLAFVATAAMWVLRPATPVPVLGLVQCVVLVGCECVLHVTGLGLRLTHVTFRHRTVARRAREQFLFEGVHATSGRNGILIFISRREKLAELVVDLGIESKEAKDYWRGLAVELTQAIRAGHTATGLCRTIDRCGEILAKHYPAYDPTRPNELPDEIRESR